MFGFDSKDCFLVFPSFFVSKAKNQKTPWVFVFFAYILSTSINQDLKNKKNSRFVLVFETFQCRKPNLKRWKTKNTPWLFFVFLRSWLIISIQKKNKNTSFFVFPFQNQQKPRENKNNLLSQNQTFSQQFCFLWFCSSSLFFLVCLLFHMIAICVLMLAYLTGPGKSNFDQSFSLKSLRTMWDSAWHRMCCDVYALEN
jgi:hypothetical protein